MILSPDVTGQPSSTERLNQEVADKALKDIEDRYQRLQLFTLPTQPETGTGRDVFLMQEVQPFYLTFDNSLSWTSNAFSQPERRSDLVYQPELAVGIDTQIDEVLDVVAELTVGMARYSKHSILDFNEYSGRISASRRFGNITVGGQYRLSHYMDRGSDDTLLRTHELTAFVAAIQPLTDNVGVTGDLSISYFYATPADNDVARITIAPAMYWVPVPSLIVFAGASYSYSYYPHYFEDIFDQARRDNQGAAFLKVRGTIPGVTWLRLETGLQYVFNDSAIGDLDYEAFSVFAGLTIIIRF